VKLTQGINKWLG